MKNEDLKPDIKETKRKINAWILVQRCKSHDS